MTRRYVFLGKYEVSQETIKKGVKNHAQLKEDQCAIHWSAPDGRQVYYIAEKQETPLKTFGCWCRENLDIYAAFLKEHYTVVAIQEKDRYLFIGGLCQYCNDIVAMAEGEVHTSPEGKFCHQECLIKEGYIPVPDNAHETN